MTEGKNPKPDFRPFVPTLEYPRVAALHGRTAEEHGAAGLANPRPRDLLFKPWEAMYKQPFVGVTTDGKPLPGLFSLGDHGAPTAAMIEATTRLIDAATPEQRAALMLPVDAREWRSWNNTEMYVYKYGLRLEEIPVPLRDVILGVVRASLSARGYDKTRDVMRFNHFLGELAMNTSVLGEWSYNFCLFGTPSTTEPWGWQLMGHHLALNCLVIAGQMVLSPAFMGAEPNYGDAAAGALAGKRLFQDEENGGLALMHALSETQRQEAILFKSSVGGDCPRGAATLLTSYIWVGRFRTTGSCATKARMSKASPKISAAACSASSTPMSSPCLKARSRRAWKKWSAISTTRISVGSAAREKTIRSITGFKARW